MSVSAVSNLFLLLQLNCQFQLVPDHVREVLTLRYEYIVAEQEVVADLTDNIRLCATCSEWCAR